MAEFNLTILTPEGKAFEGTASALTVPGQLGSLGVLAHHAPMIAGLQPGVLTVTQGMKTSFFVVGEGVIEVNLGNQVVALVDVARAVSGSEEAKDVLAATLAE